MVGVFLDSLVVMLLLVGSVIVLMWFVSACVGVNNIRAK
jgi:hypothetical protein